MHLGRGLAARDYIHEIRNQVPFDTLLVILGLLHSFFFQIRSLFERANKRPKVRGVVDGIVDRLRVKA